MSRILRTRFWYNMVFGVVRPQNSSWTQEELAQIEPLPQHGCETEMTALDSVHRNNRHRDTWSEALSFVRKSTA